MADDLTFGLSIDWDQKHVCIIGLPEKPELRFAIHIEGGFVIKGEDMALTLTAVQQVEVAVSAVDAKGNPAPVEDVEFSSSDESIVTVTPDPTDPNFATAVAVGTPGIAQVKVVADADIGDGTKTLAGLLDIEVVAAEAVSLGVSAGTPVDQPTTPLPGGPHPEHPIALPGEPTHPIAPGGGPTPEHPIAPGGIRPEHPIEPGGQPTHPIAPGGPAVEHRPARTPGTPTRRPR
jgi:hypothetical protein